MSRGNPGRLIEIIDGVHKGKKGFMYNKDQKPEFAKLKKALVSIPVDADQQALFPEMKQTEYKNVLMQYDFIKVWGFID